jgi:hypothetical protein
VLAANAQATGSSVDAGVYDGRTQIRPKEVVMVICPIAIAVGCKKCPIFKVCPLTTVIGDQKAESEQKPAKKAPAAGKKKS